MQRSIKNLRIRLLAASVAMIASSVTETMCFSQCPVKLTMNKGITDKATGSPCRVEIAEDWKLISSKDVQADGAAISISNYRDDQWYPVQRIPATVLEIPREDGVYPDLYVGKNLFEKVPQDLYKHDWWYRTTFKTPKNNE